MRKLAILSYFVACLSVDMQGQGSSFSQIPDSVLQRIDEMGNDNFDTLSELECLYFKFRFPLTDTCFQYAGKRIYFMHTHGKGKKYFFCEERRLLHITGRDRGMATAIYYFDESEKKRYGVKYDIIVHCWPKFKMSKEKIASKLPRL